MVAVSLGVRSLVWVEDPDEAWIDGEVIGVTGEDFKVASTSGKTVVAKSSNVYPKDAEAPPCGVDDMTKLAYLHEPAVNGVMINEGISQSILINGESGAGKTESTKQLMRYLAYMGGRASTDGRSVEQKVHLGTIEFTKGKEMDSSTPKDEKSWFHLKTAAELFMEMHPKKVVVDISSDDEDDDHKWLTKLLDDDDGVNDNDDEVIMVVNENKKNVVKNLKMKLKDKDCLLVDELKDIDDDECLVLENDPNEKLEVKADGGESKKGGVNEDEDDEIVIISEKGQVACRDYPHSRHLCINFPFSTTPNQSHCEQCYCYVCDSPAPCVYWGNGSAPTNHCHATDKDGIWRLARENARNISKGVQPVKRHLPVDPQRLEPAMVQPQNQITRASLINPKKVVVDISSDDEDDDHKWLTKLLGDDDVNNDDDEVIMVVNENEKNVVKNLKVKLKVEDCLLVDNIKEIDDDDKCVVLENDPNEKSEVKDDGGESKKGSVNEDEDDEIVIISEKGQVACRDYPHSRHLCINFPFSTTPSQSHCKQCYCYVCDSLAPCVYWGNGCATTDHCHATYKDSIWRLARESARNVSIGTQPVQRHLPVDPQNLAPDMVQPQNLITRPNLIPGPRASPNFLPPDEVPNACHKTQVVSNNKGKWNDEVQCKVKVKMDIITLKTREMDPKKVVVDNSSDDDHIWLTKLLLDDDDDDDEVILVVNENEKNVVKNLRVKLKAEDCLLVDT